MPQGKPLKIPFPTSTFPGASPQESAGRLINVFAEPLGDTGPEKLVYRRSCGMTLFSSPVQVGFSASGYRGGTLVGGIAYEVFAAASAANVLTLDSAGTPTILIGNLPGTRGVQIARNNAASPNVVAVDLDNGAFELDTGTVTAYNAGGILPQPKTVCFQDGYLFFGIADRRVFATDLNALTMNALSFVKVQAKSSDILMRLVPFGGLLWVFCSSCTEIWQDTAQPAPAFPYSRMVVIEYGLAQENAIAGWEDGFSILTWVAQDYCVWQLLPGQVTPLKVSPHDLERLISIAIESNVQLDARCYIVDGHKFWALSSPTWTWEFNCDTQKWNERASLVAGRDLTRWRAIYGHPAFGKWISGVTDSADLFFMDEHNFTENGLPLLARMESGPVIDFPNRMRIARADFHFVTGVGVANGATPNVVDPTVAISLSRDDGLTFGNPWYRSLGKQANSKTRVMIKNAGLSGAAGDRWRWEISDPIYAAFLNATQASELREF